MFDNPNEELKKLEEQLLAVEDTEEDFDTFYKELLREFGPEAEEPAESKPVKKKAPKNHVQTDHAKNPAKKSAKKKKKKKGIKGLVITLCLECAGIVAILLWWILRIL